MTTENGGVALKPIDKRQRIIVIYTKFWKELYVTAFRRLQSEENTEDILQDLFLSLLEKDVVLENEQSVRAFLHTRLKSRIIDFYRKETLRTTYKAQQTQVPEPDVAYTDTRLLTRELETVVQQQIDKLPTKMREIFRLSREESLSNDEIASRLDISGKTVRNQLSTALKKIRTTVHEYSAVIIFLSTVLP